MSNEYPFIGPETERYRDSSLSRIKGKEGFLMRWLDVGFPRSLDQLATAIQKFKSSHKELAEDYHIRELPINYLKNNFNTTWTEI